MERTAVIWVIFLTPFVAMVTSVYDRDFCSRRMGSIDPDGADEPPPLFFDNFHVFIEQKLVDQKKVVEIDEYYSQTAGLSYVAMNTDVSPGLFWVDTNFNEVMMVAMDQSVCEDSPFDGSDVYQLFGATKDSLNVTTLSDPAVALHWGGNARRNISYKGEDTCRGMDTQKWWTCEYAAYRDATTFTEWHIVDPARFNLPVVDPNQPQPRPILPVSAYVTGVDKNDPGNIVNFNYRYDFTHFSRIQSDDRHFRIPPRMMCANKPNSQKPLPTVPDYFKFRGEMLTIAGYDLTTPDAPQLTYTIEEYRHALGLYIQDVISVPNQVNSPNDKSYSRLVDDFNTGLNYVLDLETGLCEINVITDDKVDAIRMGNNLVQMRNSEQFFDLDPTAYQYMGIQEMRGITCDAWTAYFGTDQTLHQQNAYYTWYFANPDWMQDNNFQEQFTLPVALELTQGHTYIQFNVYEFTTDIGRSIPDLSACYDVQSSMNIEIYFNGRYDQYYTPAQAGFRQSFLKGLVRATSLNSTLRIADLDVQPAKDNKIVARFKLLDKPTVQGDVAKIPTMAPNQIVFQEIVTAVNAGQFYINVGETGNAIVYAIPNSAGQIKAASPWSQPSNVTTGTTTGSTQTSTGFTAGSLAGVGVGMLVAGVLIGFLLVLAIKKVRGGQANTEFTMKTLQPDS